MADEPTPRSSSREQQRQFRRIISNAVGELRSQEIRDSYASVGLEELIDQAIDRLEGTDDAVNPSRLQRIRRVKQDLTDNIEGIKATPPDEFRRHDPEGDVNTAPDSEDEG